MHKSDIWAFIWEWVAIRVKRVMYVRFSNVILDRAVATTHGLDRIDARLSQVLGDFQMIDDISDKVDKAKFLNEIYDLTTFNSPAQLYACQLTDIL